MMKLKALSLLGTCGLLAGLLTSCGGDAPTATVVVPTATVAAAATATVPAPTATTAVMVAPTSTTAAMVAPTSTTAAMTAPTATTGEMAAGTATTGATGGMEANPADLEIINNTLTATQALKSYHFTMIGSGDIFTKPLNIEGDYVAPDKAYMKGMLEGVQEERLTIAGKAYKKDADGKWVADDANNADPSNPVDVTSNANIISGLSTFLDAGTGWHDVMQDETLDGVQTKHFVGQLDAGKMGGGAGMAGIPSLGNVSLWIDTSTKILHKLSMTVDMGPAMEAAMGMAEAMMGTPTPGGPTATPFPSMKFELNMTISKPNDPSITVPTP